MSENDHSEVMYRLDRNERDIGELTKLVSATSETVHVFAKGMEHFAQTFAAHEKKCEVETQKLNELWDNRNKQGGRWDVVSTIAATVCGSGGIYAMIELVQRLIK